MAFPEPEFLPGGERAALRRAIVLTIALGLGLALVLALVPGCARLPSVLQLGGTPLDKNQKAETRLATVERQQVQGAQAEVHQAALALAHAHPTRPVEVARDFVASAQARLDQALGAPTAADETRWRELVAGLLSENAALRAAAEEQRAADASAAALLSQKLAAATAAAERANARALDYAQQRESLADFAAKLKLGFYVLVGLLVLGTGLSIAARFVPALGLASRVVNGVVAPGIAYAAHRAETGLQRIGEGMAKLRTTVGAGAEALIEQCFDGPADADHKTLVAAGATAAGKPPPA